MLHDISEHNISYLQSLLFVIVDLQNTYHRRSNARGTTTRAEYERRFVQLITTTVKHFQKNQQMNENLKFATL